MNLDTLLSQLEELIKQLRNEVAESLSPFVEREQEDMELLREFCHELVKVYGKGGAEMSGVYLKARERLKESGL